MSDWPFAPLPAAGFDLVVADPPWPFAVRSATGEGKGAQAHYDCMSLAEIAALPMRRLVGRHAWLFLWITAPQLPAGCAILDAWGFGYRTTIAWDKRTAKGKRRVGLGYIARSMHENVLIGAVGEPSRSGALPSLFEGVAREHSRKPEEFYRLVEAFAPQARRGELFARQTRPGWAGWGLERTRFDDATSVAVASAEAAA